jgi:hypothetical protein
MTGRAYTTTNIFRISALHVLKVSRKYRDRQLNMKPFRFHLPVEDVPGEVER